jgi:hypothetical protein
MADRVVLTQAAGATGEELPASIRSRWSCLAGDSDPPVRAGSTLQTEHRHQIEVAP